MKRVFTFTVDKEDESLAIRKMLKKHLSFSSRLLAKLRAQKRVYLNGVPLEGWMKYREGDEIRVELPEEVSHFPEEDIPIHAVYEDQDLVLIDKQPGLTVHPTKGHSDHTIANGLMKHMREQGESYKIRFVNRLDMDTSGLLIVGKNSHAQDELVRQMGNGKLHKYYTAVVNGIIPEDELTIDEPIGHPEPEQVARRVVHDGTGQESVTHLRVLRRIPGEHIYGTEDHHAHAGGYTIVQLRLDTGRTHQIRVHLAYIGYPILGDPLYGGSVAGLLDRQALHASRLEFFHPATGRPVSAEAPLPEDILQAISKIEKQGSISGAGDPGDTDGDAPGTKAGRTGTEETWK